MSYTPPPPPEGGSEETPGSTPPPPPPGYGAAPPPPPSYGSGDTGYGGGYGGPGQPAPGYGGPAYAGPPRNSSKAVAALVIGIVSPVLGFCCAIIGLVGIVAVVLGRSAQKEIALSMGALTGEGMAKAGVVLGIIGSVIGVLMTILNVFLLLNGDSTFDFNTVN